MDRLITITVFACLFCDSAICTARKLVDKSSGHQHSGVSTMEGGSSQSDIDRKMAEVESIEERQVGIMDLCNMTFPVPLDNLIELNETGQFPPNATHDSKCYLNCVFSRMRLFDDGGNFEKLLTGKILGDKKEDSKRISLFNECIQGRDKTEDPCEMTYNKVSCLIKSALDYYADDQNRNRKGDKM